jgi:hypothetical protein
MHASRNAGFGLGVGNITKQTGAYCKQHCYDEQPPSVHCRFQI